MHRRDPDPLKAKTQYTGMTATSPDPQPAPDAAGRSFTYQTSSARAGELDVGASCQ